MGASQENKKTDTFDPRAWGLPGSAIKKLGVRLHEFWERYAEYFEPQTRDSSHHALDYWLLRKIAGAGLTYMGDVPTDTQVYREKPVVGLPTKDTEHPWASFHSSTGAQCRQTQ